MNSNSVLRKYFGFEEFRPLQKEIIDTIMRGKDCLVLMPTGGGKSVCYQVPGLLMEGLTVVISPLIALMKDQVDALRLNGVEAAYMNSTLSSEEQARLMEDLTKGKIKLLYIAPERLYSGLSSFVSFLKSLNVSLFAVDEAHCISHWGHDFRPDYLGLSRLKTEFPDVPLIALTATADQLTRKDIIDKLRLHKPEVFISSFNRDNIRYIIEEKENHFKRILDFLELNKEQSGIIYCLSRAETEDTAEKLFDKGYRAAAYHAGLDTAIRSQRQEQFKRDELKIIVATIAFGMGIDKSNVRYVIHSSVPKNIESYYQETGRAGRDGMPSQALLFYSNGDIKKLKKMIASEKSSAQASIMHKKLEQIGAFCSSHTCRRKYLLNYFDEAFEAPCGNCDVCLGKSKADLFDATIIAQKALSAVKRLNERFGIFYVINFLKGSSSAKIHEEHKYLATFGKGSEFSIDEWRNYFGQLIDQGYLVQHGEYAVLKITEKGKNVLYNDQKVLLVRPKLKKVARSERRQRYAGNETAVKYNKELFEKLKELRSLIAARENVPAYLVFNDTTLSELATYFPVHAHDLQHIAGFGILKIQKYGDQFLNMIREFCDENNIVPGMGEKRKESSQQSVVNRIIPGDTQKKSFEMYLAGKSIKEIARSRKLKEGTISEHLLQYVLTGEINVLKFVSKEKLKKISSLIDEHGYSDFSFLKELASDCSYDEIKAVVNYRRRKRN